MKERKKIKVSADDNLYTVALKYNTSPSFLQEINELYPPIFEKNLELYIEPAENMLLCNHTIYAEFSSNDIDISGTITYSENSFVFQQKQVEFGGDVLVYPINLDSILSTTLMPHPAVSAAFLEDPSQPAMIILCYLTNPNDQQSVEVVVFNSSRAELNALNTVINSRFKQKKQNHLKADEINKRELRIAELKTADSLGRKTTASNMRSSVNAQMKENFYIIGESLIIDSVDIFALRRELPYRYRSYSWKRIFILSQDGTSYSTLYEKTDGSKSCVMILKTSDGSRLGCFLPQGLKNCERAYGNGDTFVFNFNPDLKVYKWSRANDSFTASTKSDILIGAGGGSAIWIDKFMHRGSSTMCETFDSPPLAKKSPFYIMDIEVWDLSFHS